MKMKRVILFLILLCVSHPAAADDCADRIRAFYAAYMENILHDESKNDALCVGFLTPGLIEKTERVRSATGADPIVRAQDMNRDAIETLAVEALGGGWYRVSYLWKKGDDATRTEIPVKAVETDGTCRIVYIVPAWNGSRYGDETIACGESASGEPDHSSARAFLASFYDAYTALYCAMPEGLDAKLAALRARSLTAAAQRRFDRAASEQLADGLEGYDLLIDHFDFDCLWRGSLRIAPCGDGRFSVSYQAGNRVHRIVVAVGEEGNSYRIAGAEVDRP